MANMQHDDTPKAAHAELERWLRSFDDPRPAPRAVDAARRAVRLALNEDWLASAAHPAPSPDAMNRVRETVRRVLGGERTTARPAAFWCSPAFGGVAAAAAMVAAVAVGWMSYVVAPEPAGGRDMLVALERALDDQTDEMDEQLVALAADLDALERELSGGAAANDDASRRTGEATEQSGGGPSDAGGDS